MYTNIKIESVGIKCDAEDCDYFDNAVEFDKDVFLNKPCPLCGSNLLTQEDYDSITQMFKLVEVLNSLDLTGVEGYDETARVTANLTMNGTGIIEQEIVNKG